MMSTATVGTGTLTVSTAITNATLGDFFTLLESGSIDGETVSYVLWEGHNVELGTGTIGGTGTTLTRTVTESKIAGVAGTAKISLLGSGTVMLAPLAADLSGGGGVSIEPETGSSPIKISAFPNAAANMGSGDRVTGLQGGANVNFSQSQLLAGLDTTGHTTAGTLYLRGGVTNYGGHKKGGRIYLYGQNGTTYKGGNTYLYAGQGYETGNGGDVIISSGDGGTGGGNAGRVYLYGAYAQQGTGGNIEIKGGHGQGLTRGNVVITLAAQGHQGNLLLVGLPTSSSGLTSGMIWANSNVLTIVP